jgi:hypothetical protein
MADKIEHLEGLLLTFESLRETRADAATDAERNTCKQQINALKERIWCVLERHYTPDDPDGQAVLTDYAAFLGQDI